MIRLFYLFLVGVILVAGPAAAQKLYVTPGQKEKSATSPKKEGGVPRVYVPSGKGGKDFKHSQTPGLKRPSAISLPPDFKNLDPALLVVPARMPKSAEELQLLAAYKRLPEMQAMQKRRQETSMRLAKAQMQRDLARAQRKMAQEKIEKAAAAPAQKGDKADAPVKKTIYVDPSKPKKPAKVFRNYR